MDAADYKYWAFISYSRRDEGWATWLHRRLEGFAVPGRLAGRATRSGTVPRRIRPVFRDRDELPTAANLGANLEMALGQSRYLIVVCSPQSASSRWVNEEVLAFKRMGRADRILCLIVGGEPNSTDKGLPPAQECFCPALRHELAADGTPSPRRTEPIAADARPGQDDRAIVLLRMVAGLLGADFDELRRRHRRQRRLRLAAAVAAAILLAAGMGGLWQHWERLRAAEAAEKQRQESLALARQSRQLLAEERAEEALTLALRAVPRRIDRPERPLVPEAVLALEAALAQTPLAQVLRGHGESVWSAAFAPDGTRLVTGSDDATARVWDAASGRAQFVLAHDRGAWVRTVAWSARGDRIATGTSGVNAGSRGRARLWDAATGALVVELDRGGPDIRQVAFSPGGDRLVTVAGNAVRLWDARTGAALATLSGHTGDVLHVAFDAGGGRLVSAGMDGTARLWNAHTGAVLRVLEGHAGWVTAAAFSPRGGRILTASHDRTARIWNADTGATIHSLGGHPDDVLWAAFDPAGATVVTTTRNRQVRLWDANTGGLRATMAGHRAAVHHAEFARAGERVLTVSYDRTVRFWDARSGSQRLVLTAHRLGLNGIATSADGRRLATVSSDRTARVWDVAQRGQRAVLRGHGNTVFAAAFDPAGRRLLTAAYDNSVRLWRVPSGELERALAPEGRVQAVAFSDDGSRVLVVGNGGAALYDPATGARAPLVSGEDVAAASFAPGMGMVALAGAGGAVRLLDWRANREVRRLDGLRRRVHRVAFDHSGARLIASDGLETRIWEAGTGRVVASLAGHEERVAAVALAPGGARAATAAYDHVVRIWDADGPRVVARLPLRRVHPGYAVALEFDRQGRRLLIAASSSNTVRLVDATDGRVRVELTGHADGVFAAAFSRDGTRVVTASSDGTARMWDARTGVQLQVFRGHAGRVMIAALDPGGRLVATGGADRTARLWEVSAGLQDLVDAAQRVAALLASSP